MSTEHDKNKVTIDDEKFIDALYAELEIELENAQEKEISTNSTDKLFTEQPSASLDQRILTAAHNAIDSTPKTIDLVGKKPSKIGKSRAWHVPLSLAASTVLVVSLVVNQGEESILPSRDIVPVPRTVQVEPALSNESVGGAERKMMAKGQSQKLAKQSTRQAKENASALLEAQKQRTMEVESKHNDDFSVEVLALQAVKSRENSMSPDKHVRGITTKEMATLKERSSASKLESTNPMLLLSLQQYQLYKEKNKQWLLRSESEQYYVIDVFATNQKTIQYKLLKKHFNINVLTRNLADVLVNSLTNEVEQKHSFKQIEALAEK